MAWRHWHAKPYKAFMFPIQGKKMIQDARSEVSHSILSTTTLDMGFANSSLSPVLKAEASKTTLQLVAIKGWSATPQRQTRVESCSRHRRGKPKQVTKLPGLGGGLPGSFTFGSFPKALKPPRILEDPNP